MIALALKLLFLILFLTLKEAHRKRCHPRLKVNNLGDIKGYGPNEDKFRITD